MSLIVAGTTQVYGLKAKLIGDLLYPLLVGNVKASLHVMYLYSGLRPHALLTFLGLVAHDNQQFVGDDADLLFLNY